MRMRKTGVKGDEQLQSIPHPWRSGRFALPLPFPTNRVDLGDVLHFRDLLLDSLGEDDDLAFAAKPRLRRSFPRRRILLRLVLKKGEKLSSSSLSYSSSSSSHVHGDKK